MPRRTCSLSDRMGAPTPQSPPLKGGEARPPFPLPAREGARGWVLAALIPLAACAAPYERPSAEFAPSYAPPVTQPAQPTRSEEHTSELQSLMRISYAVFCLKKKNNHTDTAITAYTSTTTHQEWKH